MSFRVTVAVLLMPLFASPALAQDTSQSATPAAKPVKEHKVCRRKEELGSNIAKVTCHTKDEWASIDAAAPQQSISEQESAVGVHH
jgi:hypothetical protein